MARILKMAWGDGSDENNLDASYKVIDSLFVSGPEISAPRGAESLSLDLIVKSKNATADIELIIFSSHNKEYWAAVSFLDTPTLVGDRITSEVKILSYLFKGITDNYSRHLRLNLSNSEYIKIALAGNAPGAEVKVIATFFDDMRKE